MAINWNIATQRPDFNQIANRGLQLGQEIKKYNTDKEMEGVTERLMQLMEDPNFELSADSEFPALLAQRPDLAEATMTRFKMLKESEKEDYIKDMTAARDSIYFGDPEQGLGVLAKRVAKITKKGGAPDDSIRALRLFQNNPENFVDGINSMLLAKTGNTYSTEENKPAAVEAFSTMVKNAGLTEDEAMKAARISLGLDPRAVGSSMQTIAQSPEQLKAVANAEALIVGRKTAAEVVSKMQLQPQLEAQITSSVARAKAMADKAAESRSNGSAWKVYQVGVGGLVQALGDTSTGNISGLLPAWSSEAKVAEGAIGILRPIIKDVVRSAGEGVFTDQDQKLVDQLIPSRSDDPTAIAAKVSMLDNFIRAKLKVGDTSLFGDEPLPEVVAPDDDEFTGFKIIPQGN